MSKRQPSSRSRFGLQSSLWPVCYSTAVILIHGYLIYRGVRRYMVYKSSVPYSNSLLAVICVVALATPLIVISSFIKLGSYANDAVQVGYGMLKKEMPCSGQSICDRVRLGAPMLASILHIICAYLLLITTDLTVIQGEQLHSPQGSSNSRQFSTNMLLYRADNSSSGYYLTATDSQIASTDMELANLLISLTVHSYRNVSIFWHTNHLFTIIYWLQSTAALILHALSHLGLQSLLRQTGVSDIFILNEAALVALYVLGNTILVLSSLCVSHFGYGAVREYVHNFLKQLGCHMDMVSDWAAYLPHGLALTSILVYVGCNAPIMYDYVSAYSVTHNQIFIAHLTACVVYMLLWIILWFFFTVKQNWQFEIDGNSLKKIAILQNRCVIFPNSAADEAVVEDTQSREVPVNTQGEELYLNKLANEDNLSNSTTSTVNGGSSRSTNGILTHKVNSRPKRNSSEQKVKFQEATKIVIETNLDSDLDTIPESDNECADSAMFSGSAGSNDSADSPTANLKGKSKHSDLILTPRSITVQQKGERRRMWSSTGDLDSSNASATARANHVPTPPGRPSSVVSEQYSCGYRAPYSPRDMHSPRFTMYSSNDMSSAV